jgi:hypothetical protein
MLKEEINSTSWLLENNLNGSNLEYRFVIRKL